MALYTAHTITLPDQEAGPTSFTEFCLPQALVQESGGSPDCVLVRALYPNDSAPSGTLDACRACAEPGLAPLPASIPPTSVSADLATFGCVCAVEPSAGAMCPSTLTLPTTQAAWCYVTGADATKLGCAWPQLILVNLDAASGAALYLACFPPGTTSQ